MLVVPVLTGTGEKRVPLLCIALIVINSLLYFSLIPEDTRVTAAAYEYYEESGLLDLELDAYREYLETEGKSVIDADLDNEKQRQVLLRRMFSDDGFQELIENGRAIAATDPRHQEWQSKRTAFERQRNKASSYRFGYSPKRDNTAGLFTYMFMHGGLMHLLGNMVFLYLVGSMLEAAIGRGFFIVLYLVTGVCSSLLFGIVYPNVPGPLVGASGSISGLMGAYGVVFGLRRIRVFYSLGFYFNYAMMPALVLFPIWLINEFFQLYTNQTSNVAYVAHIGGLLSGVVIGAAYKRFLGQRIDALFAKAEQKQDVDSYLEKGLKRLVAFDFAGARTDFEKVLAIDPSNLQAIRQLYVIDKGNGDSERFHESAHRLLNRLKNGVPEEYLELFEDYRATTKKPHLTVDMLETLSHLYLKKRQHLKAAPLVAALLKRQPGSTNLPGYLLSLGDGFRQRNRPAEARKCYSVLASRYPISAEGSLAKSRLAELSPR